MTNPYSSGKNYIIAFLITVGIFATIIFLSRSITGQKIQAIKDAQDSIALDIASSETEFSLLSELSCKNISASSLSKELNSMEGKIQYTETNKLTNKEELLKLKKFYFLLEIKDFLLLQKINERCGNQTLAILYIYTMNCEDCTKQGYVLTALREKYPGLRVYSFDHTSDLSALHALLSIYNVPTDQFPAMIINEKVYSGFHSIEDIETAVPELENFLPEEESSLLKTTP